MNNYRKTFIFSLIFTLTIMCAAPAVTLADDPLVPCGTETYPYTTTVGGKEVETKVGDKKVGGTVKNPCGFGDFITLVNNITNFLIILGASFSAVAFGYAGFLMMTAAGEMGKIEEAKAIFGKVVVGFLFMLSAWLIVHAFEAAFLDEREFKSFLS